MVERSPSAIVLAGPNGAGKTTAARTLLAEKLRLMTFVNADVIAQGAEGRLSDSPHLFPAGECGPGCSARRRESTIGRA